LIVLEYLGIFYKDAEKGKNNRSLVRGIYMFNLKLSFLLYKKHEYKYLVMSYHMNSCTV